MLKFFVFMLFLSGLAFGQASEPSFLDFLPFLKSLPELGKVLAFLLALQVFLRGLAEALTRIADYTESTWDNKLAAWLSEAVWFLGVVLGKLGYGEPKLVTAEKVAAAMEENIVQELTK